MRLAADGAIEQLHFATVTNNSNSELGCESVQEKEHDLKDARQRSARQAPVHPNATPIFPTTAVFHSFLAHGEYP